MKKSIQIAIPIAILMIVVVSIWIASVNHLILLGVSGGKADTDITSANGEQDNWVATSTASGVAVVTRSFDGPPPGENEHTVTVNATNGSKLIVRNGKSIMTELSYSNVATSTFEDEVVYVTPSGKEHVLYTAQEPYIIRDTIQISPDGAHVFFSGIGKETIRDFIVDTQTGQNILPAPFTPEDSERATKDLSNLYIDRIIWSRSNSSFVFHSDYPVSDYANTDGVFVYDSATQELKVVKEVTIDNKDAGYVGYLHISLTDPTHVQFDEVRYQDRDSHDKASTVIGTYVYDILSGMLKKI